MFELATIIGLGYSASIVCGYWLTYIMDCWNAHESILLEVNWRKYVVKSLR